MGNHLRKECSEVKDRIASIDATVKLSKKDIIAEINSSEQTILNQLNKAIADILPAIESSNEYTKDFIFEKFSDIVRGDKFTNHQESKAVYLGPGRPLLYVWGMSDSKHRAVGVNFKIADRQSTNDGRSRERNFG